MTKDALLTTLTSLPHEWMVEFQFKPTNLDHPDWTSIFHMTSGGDNGNLGDRTPAVFFHPNKGLEIQSAVNNVHNYFANFPAPPIGEWTKIRISQELMKQEFKYRISINETEKLDVENLKAVGFKSVKVFVANPFHKAQPGFVKNLSINVKGE